MTQTLVRGYEIIYPDGCKEVSDDIRPDELRKRLKDIWKAILNLAEASEPSHEDSLLNSSTPGGSGAPNFPDFRGLAFYLSTEQFTEHSDADIRLRVACCLCAIIKLYCPDSPFTGMTDTGSLYKRILNLFAHSIRPLSDIKSKEDPQFMKLFALFSTCCQLDIFVWCSNAEDGSDILMEVFRSVFHVIKNMEVWAWTDIVKVKHLVLDMLSSLIVQNESILTQEIIIFLLRFLMDPAKSAQPLQNELARDLLLRNATHLEYWIHMIIQSALLNAESTRPLISDSTTPDEGASAERVGPAVELGDHVYLLIYEIHTLQDSLIKPILPSLAVKLKSSETKNRKRSVRLLSKLFGENESTLHRTQSALWEAFLGRFNDIEAPVRELCVRLVPQMVRSNPDLAEPLLAAVGERAKDLQESVRELAVKVVGEMLKDCPSSGRPRQLMDILIDRARDKVISIRKEAAGHLANIYRRMLTQGTLGESNWEQAVTILNTIMHLYYQNRVEDKVSVERLFKSSLVPYTQSSDERMKSLLRFYCALDEHSIKAFNELMKTQFFLLTLQRQILQILVENQGRKISGEMNSLLMEKLAKLTAHLQNPDKSLDFLKRFFNHVHEDRSLRQLMVKMTAAECPCSRAAEYLKEILRRVNLPVSRGGSGGGANDAYQNCIRVLLERSAPVIFDREAAQELVTLLVVVRETPEAALEPGEPVIVDQKKGLNLLLALSLYVKEILCSVDDLVDYLLTTLDSPALENGTDEEMQIVCLQMLFNLCSGGMYAGRENNERFEAVQDQLLSVLQRHAVPAVRSRSGRGGSKDVRSSVTELLAARRRSKFAILCLHSLISPTTSPYGKDGEFDKDSEEDEDEENSGMKSRRGGRILECIHEVVDLCIENSDQVPALCALGQVALLLPEEFGDKLKALISRELIPKIVMKDPTDPGAIPKDAVNAWLPDTSVSAFTWLRMESLKLMTRWLVGLQTTDRELSHAIMKLLYTVILGHGDLNRRGKIRGAEMARMRLMAAKCWLRLAQQRCYVDTVETSWFQTMARIIVDPCDEVRSGFLRKLHRGLISLRLPLEYIGIFALVGSVEDAQFRNNAKNHLASNVQARKDFLTRNRSFSEDPKRLYALLPEYVLPYALHLLAHDPEWKKVNDAEILTKMKSCLWFLLEPIVLKGDNFSFLRKMLEKMKHAKDALCPDDKEANSKLYCLCDIALGLVMTKSAHLVLKEYPVEPALPSRLFTRADRGFVNPEFTSLATAQVRFSPPKGAAGQRTMEQGLIPPQLLKKKNLTGGIAPIPAASPAAAAGAAVAAAKKKPAAKVTKNHPGVVNGNQATVKTNHPSNMPGRLYPVAMNAVSARKRPADELSPQPPTRVLTGPEDSESEPEDVVRFTPTKRRRIDSPVRDQQPRVGSPAGRGAKAGRGGRGARVARSPVKSPNQKGSPTEQSEKEKTPSKRAVSPKSPENKNSKPQERGKKTESSPNVSANSSPKKKRGRQPKPPQERLEDSSTQESRGRDAQKDSQSQQKLSQQTQSKKAPVKRNRRSLSPSSPPPKRPVSTDRSASPIPKKTTAMNSIQPRRGRRGSRNSGGGSPKMVVAIKGKQARRAESSAHEKAPPPSPPPQDPKRKKSAETATRAKKTAKSTSEKIANAVGSTRSPRNAKSAATSMMLTGPSKGSNTSQKQSSASQETLESGDSSVPSSSSTSAKRSTPGSGKRKRVAVSMGKTENGTGNAANVTVVPESPLSSTADSQSASKGFVRPDQSNKSKNRMPPKKRLAASWVDNDDSGVDDDSGTAPSSGHDADVSSQDSLKGSNRRGSSSGGRGRPRIMEDVPMDKSWPLRRRAAADVEAVKADGSSKSHQRSKRRK